MKKPAWTEEAKSMLKNLKRGKVPRRFVVKHLVEIARLPFVRPWREKDDGENDT